MIQLYIGVIGLPVLFCCASVLCNTNNTSEMKSSWGEPEHYSTGECKTWTLDCGLDCGLDYGLDYGLDSGLDCGQIVVQNFAFFFAAVANV